MRIFQILSKLGDILSFLDFSYLNIHNVYHASIMHIQRSYAYLYCEA